MGGPAGVWEVLSIDFLKRSMAYETTRAVCGRLIFCKSGSSSYIIILLVFIFSLGFLLRGMSEKSVINPSLVYSPGIKEKIPGTKPPEDTVKPFYLLIDEGSYEKVWKIVLKPELCVCGAVSC